MRNYIKAARLRTLPLSISGILVGSFVGLLDANRESLANLHSLGICAGVTPIYKSTIFWLAICTTIGFQVLSNFANDYGDGIKGTDTNRNGEQRMVSSGMISPKQMKLAMRITSFLTLCTAVWLIYVAFGKTNFGYSVIFFGLGVAAIVAAIKYTVGTSAYGYSGFGDLFVFLFFGLVAVVGTYFLYTKKINFFIFLPAFSIGLLSTAVLNLNNMRDRVNDAKVGKNTLVVKIGSDFAKYYHYYLIGASLLFALLYTALRYSSPYQFLFLIAYVPLFKHIIFVMHNKEESMLDGELKKVALSTFIFALLFGIGQIL